MEEKTEKRRGAGEKLIFWRVLLIVSAVFVTEVIIYFTDYKDGKDVTGMSIGGNLAEMYSSVPSATRIFIMLQWVLLFLALAFVYLKDRRIKCVRDELNNIDLEKASHNSKTEFDTLYNLLKEKKHLKLSTFSRLFNTDEDTVMGWCKTLESNNLVNLDYSSSGGVVVKLAE